jgi:hypothetical protein
MGLKTLAIFEHLNWGPTRNDLRISVLSLAGAIVFWSGIAEWRSGAGWGAILPWWVGAAVLAFIALLVSPVARSLYFAFHIPAAVILYLTSRLIILILFFLVFTPVGVLVRIFGRNPLQLRPRQGSIWDECTASRGVDRYYHQF